jgi:hypothetical protein
MKQFWAVVVLIIAVIAFLVLRPGHEQTITVRRVPPIRDTFGSNGITPSPSQKPLSPPALASSVSPASSDISSRAVTPAPVPEAANLAPATIMENMRGVIRSYGSRFGGNPVGTNPEITAALAGNNPNQVNFIPPDAGLRVDDKGELVDAWGTPFFFHQLSGTVMEIHSAGPDRKMWTADDLVVK